MSVVDQLARQASRLANDVQLSLRRARVEGERRLLQRQYRVALEDLGLRTYDLVRAGTLPEEPLATELAAIERTLIEREAKDREIAQMQADDGAGAAAGHDAAFDAAFPMMGEPGTPGAGTHPSGGPGWDAAERFFRSDR